MLPKPCATARELRSRTGLAESDEEPGHRSRGASSSAAASRARSLPTGPSSAALARGVSGWVRNRRDGRVEGLATISGLSDEPPYLIGSRGVSDRRSPARTLTDRAFISLRDGIAIRELGSHTVQRHADIDGDPLQTEVVQFAEDDLEALRDARQTELARRSFRTAADRAILDPEQATQTQANEKARDPRPQAALNSRKLNPGRRGRRPRLLGGYPWPGRRRGCACRARGVWTFGQ